MTEQQFIHAHRTDDVHQLAFLGQRYPDINMPWVLDQIAGWQTARRKLPLWAATDGVVYPPHISMEQCSSEQTAFYKQRVARRIIEKTAMKPTIFADLTGGFGVDFSFIAGCFNKAIYVEKQPHLCEIAEHNLRLLVPSSTHIDILNADGTDVLKSHDTPFTLIYLDPARRNENGGRTYAIEDCTPNVIALNDLLLEKAEHVIIKLSPMLDWRKAVADMHGVSEVHIISAKNECKELLLVLDRDVAQDRKVLVRCVNDDDEFEFWYSGISSMAENVGQCVSEMTPSSQPQYLYVPNASVMKAGCFHLLTERYPVRKAGKDSNLFFSDETVAFPGRCFRIKTITSLNKSAIRAALSGVSKANIAVRNFPLSADELRKKLKLKDGGSTYIFGTTTPEGHQLIIAENISVSIR